MKLRLILGGLGLLAVDRLGKVIWGSSQNSSLFFWQINQGWLILVGFGLIAGLLVWLLRVWWKAKNWLVLGLWLIILGGLSNLFDRMVYGYVIDWIYSPISIFNLADGMIVIGCGLVLLAGIDKV